MNINRLPMALITGGLVLKALLVLLWRLSPGPRLLKLLVFYDPGARYFAEVTTRLFFDYRGITMAPGAPVFYEIFLVIGFGIECLLAGFLLRWLFSRFRGTHSARTILRMP